MYAEVSRAAPRSPETVPPNAREAPAVTIAAPRAARLPNERLPVSAVTTNGVVMMRMINLSGKTRSKIAQQLYSEGASQEEER